MESLAAASKPAEPFPLEAQYVNKICEARAKAADAADSDKETGKAAGGDPPAAAAADGRMVKVKFPLYLH